MLKKFQNSNLNNQTSKTITSDIPQLLPSFFEKLESKRQQQNDYNIEIHDVLTPTLKVKHKKYI